MRTHLNPQIIMLVPNSPKSSPVFCRVLDVDVNTVNDDVSP